MTDPWTHLAVGILLPPFFGALVAALFPDRRRNGAWLAAVVSSGLTFAASLGGLAYAVIEGPVRYHLGGWQPPMGIELVMDPLAAFFCAVVTGMTFFVFIHGRSVVERETPHKAVPFYSAALLLLGGLLGIVLTGDLFNLYVFLEISSLAGYALVAIGDRRAPVSAFRYLILGTIGASFYLLGVAFLFMETGSLNMNDVAEVVPVMGESPATLAGLVLIVLGIGLKMALFPMHGWLSDAYTYATSTATAIIAPIGTKVAAYVLIRTCFHMFDPEFVRAEIPLADILGYLGAAGIVWGSIMAIAQNDLKRMLAFSSVSQVGYIALGVGLASPYGLIGAVLHTLNHAVMKACLFLVNTNLHQRLGHTRIDRLDRTTRIRMPWTMAAFTVAAISMIGLPPTAGFFSKWYLVLGSWEQANYVFLGVIVISSLLNVVYFFRVLEKVYLRSDGEAYDDASEREDAGVRREEVRASMLFPTLFLGASLLVLGLANAYIVIHVIRPMIPAGL